MENLSINQIREVQWRQFEDILNLDSEQFKQNCKDNQYKCNVRDLIYDCVAFNNMGWATYFEDKVVEAEHVMKDFESLPVEEIVRNFKNMREVFPGKTAQETLVLVRIPKTLNGGVSLESLYQLGEKLGLKTERKGWESEELPNRYTFIHASLDIKESTWVLMTKEVLPGSTSKNLEEQKQLIEDLAQKGLDGYKMPSALEVSTCLLAQYANNKERLLPELDPLRYILTRCSSDFWEPNNSVVVGAFSTRNFSVESCGDDVRVSSIGVVAIRMFSDEAKN